MQKHNIINSRKLLRQLKMKGFKMVPMSLRLRYTCLSDLCPRSSELDPQGDMYVQVHHHDIWAPAREHWWIYHHGYIAGRQCSRTINRVMQEDLENSIKQSKIDNIALCIH